MKKIIILYTFLYSAVSFSQTSYKDSLENSRIEKQNTLSDTTKGVLNKEDLTHFSHTNYFAVDTNFIVSVSITKDKGKRFKMPTSTEREPIYRRYGYIDFTLKGEKLRLTVYQNMALKNKKKYKNHYFIPFRDLTSAEETYGGGRYLDIQISKNENIKTIDFNLAYNPYCAYSHRYSCPIPPKENTLKTRIEAGEQTPSYHDY